jgi:hypothetical protein
MAFNVEELQAVYGLTQMRKAKKALNRLSNWNPTYRTGESIFQEATSKTPSGFSAQEKAAYNNDLARQATQRYRLASQSNPNMSANIQAGIGYGSLAALNNFAKNDAALKQQKIGQLAGAITAQDNANVNYQMNQKSQMEQAYGEAYKAGLSNVVGAIKSKENDLKSVASFMIPGAGAAAAASGQQSLGQMAAGKATPSASAGGIFGNKVAPGYQTPLNNSWRPFDTPVTPPVDPINPYPMQGWITNPNQFRP